MHTHSQRFSSARQRTRPRRWVLRVAAAFVCLPLLYALAAVVLGLLPINRAWRPAAQGTDVWLTTNGVHAALVLPLHTADTDWVQWLAPEGRPDAAVANGATHVVFGWGDRAFFLHTPQWSDLKIATALHALSGLNASLMRVDFVATEALHPQAIRMRLSPEAHARLVAGIRNSFALNAAGQAIALPGTYAGYANSGAFYPAQGHYSLVRTCNQWVRDRLAEAGIRTAWWAPLDKALFWQVRQAVPTPHGF